MIDADADTIKITPLKGLRGMIANNMRRSLDEAAQLTHHAVCSVENMWLRKEKMAEQGMNISIEDLLADYLVRTLKKHPTMNGRIEDGEIRVYRNIDLSFAIGLPGGKLMAPAVFAADQKDIQERALARRDALQRAKTGGLTVSEMTGGTFTLTNIGRSRVRFFTPIINLPQLAILGVGETYTELVIDNGQLAEKRMMGLSLTFDHRGIDGAPAADFLSDLCQEIESE
ncbi:2-oxo acid dehydrogenase subunit E2 [Neptuniibacter pectenicola]|jgi:pyruvate dehydrogenase E2 component (dihydrolipoamide acetyltransferase)|uniref:2-oxo acid dehydrogenase subunit E2 n=1 Tax=Neptuniibacter pectenicola TaxID=1806669 RepID=UPI0007996B9C|nr:2-oxo acid dehydrogenase subunit E2 [Neptuniibacter pectenicola]KXJ49899.1 MAG: acetoin dehydrogenase [Neptuniibacter sp. Phe_28]|tara:strand:+ start:321 stop:1004 length:684 start_codon:yes stop_codon:yes gene_type:complete